MTEEGIPSICSSSAPAKIGALPRIRTPPQRPFSTSTSKVDSNSPTLISSRIEVNTIGLEAVPLAWMLPSLATNNTDAKAPCPFSPLTIVPASIVKVALAATITLPFNTQALSLVMVKSLLMIPEILVCLNSTLAPPIVLVSVISSVVQVGSTKVLFTVTTAVLFPVCPAASVTVSVTEPAAEPPSGAAPAVNSTSIEPEVALAVGSEVTVTVPPVAVAAAEVYPAAAYTGNVIVIASLSLTSTGSG